VLAEVEFQSEATSEQVRATQRDLIYSKDRLSESEAVLNRRLRDIYKMGPLHTVQVLLGARSFTDLLNRYRYLQQIATYDRQLVQRVRALESDLADRDDDLRQRMAQLGVLRRDRVAEVAQLRSGRGGATAGTRRVPQAGGHRRHPPGAARDGRAAADVSRPGARGAAPGPRGEPRPGRGTGDHARRRRHPGLAHRR
jgi:hypothetical protein